MIRLLDVEVRRILARRTFRVLMALLVVGTAIVMITQGVRSNRNLAAAHARAAAEAHIASAAGAGQGCAPAGVIPAQPAPAGSAPAGGAPSAGAPSGTAAGSKAATPACGAPPTAADFYTDPRFFLATAGPDLVTGGVISVGILGFVIGASLIGAEWSAGTFPALMTWEPRRGRLLAAKTGAALAVMLVVGVLAMALNLGAGWLIAATRGSLAHTTSGLMTSLVLRGLRGLVVIGLLTLVGTAVAGLTRSTAAAIGVAVAYLVGVELALGHFLPGWARWQLTNNAAALLDGRTVYLATPIRTVSTLGSLRGFPLSPARAAVYLLLVGAGLFVAHAVTLLRRDAT